MGKLKSIYEKIYGPNITNDLLVKDVLEEQLVSKSKIQKALAKCQNRESTCSKCPEANHQDFPGFCGPLKYDETNKIVNKDIIIFGLEVSPKDSIVNSFKLYDNVDWSNIHVWYELGYFKEDEIKNLMDGAPPWKNIDMFFPLKQNITRFYGTDIAKCYSSLTIIDRKEAFKRCSEFLFRELDCFKDDNLIFILQGNDVRDFFKKFLFFKKNKNFLKFLLENQERFETLGIKQTKGGDFPIEIGTFSPREMSKLKKKGKYLRIYHSGQNTIGFWKKFQINKDNSLIKELIARINKYFLLF